MWECVCVCMWCVSCMFFRWDVGDVKGYQVAFQLGDQSQWQWPCILPGKGSVLLWVASHVLIWGKMKIFLGVNSYCVDYVMQETQENVTRNSKIIFLFVVCLGMLIPTVGSRCPTPPDQEQVTQFSATRKQQACWEESHQSKWHLNSLLSLHGPGLAYIDSYRDGHWIMM